MKKYTTIERIIAKIDNDFNPDNTDWIPRVAAWCIDAMSQIKVLQTEIKRHKIPVKNRIAKSGCVIDTSTLVVYDENGCKIKEYDGNGKFDVHIPSTGCCHLSDQIAQAETGFKDSSRVQIDITNNCKDIDKRMISYETTIGKSICDKKYIFDGCDTFEINWDAAFIYIDVKAIKTTKSTIYGVEFPVIPNNGLLIEALTFFCIYKMLLRGYKHPVMNLNASRYGTNPYYTWSILKEEAKRSVLIDEQGEVIEDDGMWRSKFYIETFPQNK